MTSPSPLQGPQPERDPTSPVDPPSLSLEALEQVDALCLEFERGWRAGHPVAIEEIVSRVQGTIRAALLQELLGIELEYRARKGELLDADSYYKRFPQDQPLVEQVIAKFQSDWATADSGFSSAHHVAAASDASPLPLRIRYVGNYEILQEVARGGMGVVFRARQRPLGRIVALKMMSGGHLASPAGIARFEREAQLAARLQHPNIVAVHEVGRHEGLPYFSMDYVEGHSLAERVREHPLTARDAARYLLIAGRAVAAAHEAGVLHRDLKPSNILIDAEDNVRITDFGLARLVESGETLTASGSVVGTPSYMPPEQAAGNQAQVGIGSDVYSLGAVLYELLTSRPPFAAATVAETLHQVKTQEPVPPRLLNPTVPRDLESICLKCLEKEPRHRYDSAQGLVDDLDNYLQGRPIKARPISRVARTWRWCRRNPAAALAMCLLILLAFGSPAVIVMLTRQTHELQGKQARIEQLLDDTKAALTQSEISQRRARDAQRLAEQESQARLRALYLSDMKRMEWLWSSGELHTMRTLLDRHIGRPGQPDGRQFEWFYWQRKLHRELRRLEAGESVYCMAITPDRTHLATASAIGPDRIVVCIWDLTNAKLERTLTELTMDVTALAFLDDLSSLCVVLGNHTQQVWDWRNGQLLSSQGVFFESNVAGVDQRREAYAFAASGRFFAVSSLTSVILRAKGQQPYSEFRGDVPGLVRWRLSKQVQSFELGDTRPIDRPWHVSLSGELDLPVEEDGGTVFALEVSPDEQSLAAGSRGGELLLWDVDTGQQRFCVTAHEGIIWDIAFSPDGRSLATASKDGLVKVWDVVQGTLLFTLRGHKGSVRAVAFSPDGGLLATGGDDQTVRVWSSAGGSPLAVFLGHDRAVVGIAFDKGGESLWSTSRDGTLKQWPLADDDRPIVIADSTPLYCCQVAPDQQTLAAAGSKHEIAVWDLASSEMKTLLVGQHDQIFHLCFTADGSQVVGGAWDGTFSKWDLASGKLCWERHPPIQPNVFGMPHAAISHDAEHVACRGSDQKLRIVGLESNQETILPVEGVTSRVLFAPDGKQLLAVTHALDASGKVEPTSDLTLWETDTGHLVAHVVDGVRIIGPAFSGNGRYLAWHERPGSESESADSSAIAVWDRTPRQVIQRLPLPQDAPNARAIALSTDGASVAALAAGDTKAESPGENVLLVWNTATATLVQRIPEAGSFLTFHANDSELIVVGYDGRVRVRSVGRGTTMHELTRPSGPVMGAVFLAGGEALQVVGFAPSSSSLPQMFTTRLHLDDSRQIQRVTQLSMRNGNAALILLADETIVHSGALWRCLQLDPTRIERYRLSTAPLPWEAYAVDSNQAFILTSTGALLRGQVGGGVEPAIAENALRQEQICNAIAASRDGRWLAVATDRVIHLWNGSTLEPVSVLVGHQDSIRALAFSRDGTRLASGATDRTVRVWDVVQAKSLSVLMGHAQAITCVAFDADGRTVVSSSRDGTIQLWDVETGQNKTQLSGHDGPVNWIGFSPDESVLASAGEDGTVRFWRTMPR